MMLEVNATKLNHHHWMMLEVQCTTDAPSLDDVRGTQDRVEHHHWMMLEVAGTALAPSLDDVRGPKLRLHTIIG